MSHNNKSKTADNSKNETAEKERGKNYSAKKKVLESCEKKQDSRFQVLNLCCLFFSSNIGHKMAHLLLSSPLSLCHCIVEGGDHPLRQA